MRQGSRVNSSDEEVASDEGYYGDATNRGKSRKKDKGRKLVKHRRGGYEYAHIYDYSGNDRNDGKKGHGDYENGDLIKGRGDGGSDTEGNDGSYTFKDYEYCSKVIMNYFSKLGDTSKYDIDDYISAMAILIKEKHDLLTTNTGLTETTNPPGSRNAKINMGIGMMVDNILKHQSLQRRQQKINKKWNDGDSLKSKRSKTNSSDKYTKKDDTRHRENPTQQDHHHHHHHHHQKFVVEDYEMVDSDLVGQIKKYKTRLLNERADEYVKSVIAEYHNTKGSELGIVDNTDMRDVYKAKDPNMCATLDTSQRVTFNLTVGNTKLMLRNLLYVVSELTTGSKSNSKDNRDILVKIPEKVIPSLLLLCGGTSIPNANSNANTNENESVPLNVNLAETNDKTNVEDDNGNTKDSYGSRVNGSKANDGDSSGNIQLNISAKVENSNKPTDFDTSSISKAANCEHLLILYEFLILCKCFIIAAEGLDKNEHNREMGSNEPSKSSSSAVGRFDDSDSKSVSIGTDGSGGKSRRESMLTLLAKKLTIFNKPAEPVLNPVFIQRTVIGVALLVLGLY
ncbi:hypothetical protein AX774_g306 [Zancudomyces culisetae]|uniref:Uncharacterized protein n=1 Tax=Zancudomyces culisetae TaxID=1213189 RepID=A0A1R1PYT6_ZANCU|nr:hypothetical protein AX774_g306 [Zancudomyces culisetae]|eukprot:OMH86120.1 hypothetical protein AX774_g306 [Zancudomyces culisetae]